MDQFFEYVFIFYFHPPSCSGKEICSGKIYLLETIWIDDHKLNYDFISMDYVRDGGIQGRSGLFISTLPLYFTISDIVYRWRYECRYLIKEVPEKKSESYQKFFKNAKFKCPVGLIPVTIFCKQ